MELVRIATCIDPDASPMTTIGDSSESLKTVNKNNHGEQHSELNTISVTSNIRYLNTSTTFEKKEK